VRLSNGNKATDASQQARFRLVPFIDGVMLQRGQRSTDRDAWLWLPSGTSNSQAIPWTSALGLSQWRESYVLNLVAGGPACEVQFLPVSAEFIRDFPQMSAVDARQHPQQGPLLDMGRRRQWFWPTQYWAPLVSPQLTSQIRNDQTSTKQHLEALGLNSGCKAP
jgi:hypothetical protein